MLESNLEIKLISRREVDERDAEFRTFILGVPDPTTTPGRYITTGFSERIGDARCDLNLENYYVTNLIWTLDGTEQVIQSEDFDRSPESQNNAFEMIQEVVRVEGDNLTREEKDVGMPGPKRIEIEIQRNGILCHSGTVSRGVSEKKKIVVTGYLPPLNQFNHTVRGRVFYQVSKSLGQTVEAFHSDQWWITKLETYNGNNTSSLQSIGRGEQDKAWEKVGKFLKEDMNESERTVLKNWVPPLADLDDDYDLYPNAGGDYWGRGASAYQPPVAEFRVSGDEIGAKIHLEQMERLVQKGNFTAKEMLAEAEKKKKAEKSTGTKHSTSISASSASERSGSHGGFNCAYCQLPNCNGCDPDFGEAWGALPFLGRGRHLIH